MTTLLFTHHDCLEHDTGPHHPECADRLKAILAVLHNESFAAFLHSEEAPHATREQLLRVHPEHHIENVLSHLPHGDHVRHIDSDTVMSAGSGDAALRAAGAAAAAVEAVALGQARNAFCAVRPPGHHAERAEAMGFCFFNNVAVGAFHAREAFGYKRVAVIDFDVHHGNGTQHIFYDEPSMFYGSIHQADTFPGTGHATEQGGFDNIVNIPLPPGTTGERWREAFSTELRPKLEAFKPDFLLISAGFDAHAADPLAHFRLSTADFSWATNELLDVARIHCGNRVVSVLEGGYDIPALAASVAAHVRALMGS